MNSRDLLKSREKRIRQDWFKDHHASTSPPGDISMITWKKAGTSCYAVYYALRQSHGTLMVYGDLGEAIYRWYSPFSFKNISGLNLQYFHSKTCASELGRVTENYEWDERLAQKNIFEHFKMYKDCKGYKKFKDSYLSKTLHNKQEFLAELHQGDVLCDIFGQDSWEWVGDVGNVIPIRCQAHLIGIKMACEWRCPT